MLSRAILSSLSLLILAITLLANCTPPPNPVRSALPLTPPPLTAQPGRVGPAVVEAASILTNTAFLSATLALSHTETLPTEIAPTAIITATATVSASTTVVSATAPVPNAILLPTVTPTPAAEVLLLPTPTPTLVSPIAASIPLTTALAPTTTVPLTVPITAQSIATNSVSSLPSPFVTVTLPLPPSYQAQGSFVSQTVFTDNVTSQQQGSFTILQAAATNQYGANQHYTLHTQRGTGTIDVINVYQVDDYVAVSYTADEWMLVRRDQGSNIVRAIQPLTDLALLFPRIMDQAELVGSEQIAGISTLRYHLDDPAGQGARLIQPLLALTGEIRSLQVDAWIAVPGGYVAAYNFQVALSGARVLDANLNEARAAQSVTWTYQLTPLEEAQEIIWPEDAPTPTQFPVPGFEPGSFPIPPNTELLALVGGVPDLVSTLTLQEIDSFYRTELFLLGWTVEGEGGLLLSSREGTTIQLLITEETSSGGSRITILPSE